MWGLLRVYNGRAGLQTDLLTLPNNVEGAAPLTTNDASFAVDSTFPTGSTDFLDSTDSSVLTDSTMTTDTSLMSGTMLGTDTTSTTTFTYNADGSVATVTDNTLASDVQFESDLLAFPPTTTIVTSLPTDFATGKSFMTGVCPGTAPRRTINVTAVNALALPGGKLVYNSRTGNGGALNDPTAIMYFRSSDINSLGRVKFGVPIEPLVVRAAAGECINFILNNRLPPTQADLAGCNTCLLYTSPSP